MEASLNLYYNTLFDPEEHTCFAWNNNDTSVIAVSRWLDQRSPWLCMNPLNNELDYSPENSILPWARSSLPRRADCNVTTLRNILIEMDSVPLDDQFKIINEIGMPFSTSVYSGKKSIHFIISLSDPCLTHDEYMVLVDNVHRSVPAKVDGACRNPSRLTRNPGVLRPETNKLQKLIEVRSRVDKQLVIEWSESRGVKPVVKTQKQLPESHISKVPPTWVMGILRNGVTVGDRNNTMFRVACALARVGFGESEILSTIISIPGMKELPQREIVVTVKSAVSRSGEK